MTAFSPTRAAFEGFRVLGAHPWSFALWFGCYLAVPPIIGLLVIATIGRERVIALSSRFAAAFEQPARIPEFILHFGWIPAGLLLLTLLLAVTICTAIYRAVLTPGQFQVGYLRLGLDELRLLVVSLLTPLLIPTLPIAIASPIAFKAFRAGGTIGVIGFISILAICAIAVWASVRLMLVGPMTLDRGEHSIQDSWRLTKGHFWPLLWMFVLSIFLGVVVPPLVGILAQVLLSLVGGMLGIVGSSSPEIIAALSGVIVFPLVSTLAIVIVAAPAAAAYRDFHEELPPAEV